MAATDTGDTGATPDVKAGACASATNPSTRPMPPQPELLANHFIKQYYGEVLPKKPLELHRFYKEESVFTHAQGTTSADPTTGLDNIKEKIKQVVLKDATVDLECGSIDAQHSQNDGVLLTVTGAITLAGGAPRQFVQVFFLACQRGPDDVKHNYFVLNDIFRFLEPVPAVLQAAVAGKMGDAVPAAPTAASGEAVGVAVATQAEVPAAPLDERDVPEVDAVPAPEPETTPQAQDGPESVPDPETTAESSAPGGTTSVSQAEQGAANGGGTGAVTDEAGAGAGAGEPTSQPMPSDDGGHKVYKSWASMAAAAATPADTAPGLTATGSAGGGDSSPTPALVAAPAAAASDVAPASGPPASFAAAASASASEPNGVGPRASGGSGSGTGTRRGATSPAAVPEAPLKSLYVKNIPSDCTEKDLRSTFEEFGPLVSVSIVTGRGFGFVNFADSETASAVLAAADRDFTINGKRLIVVEARQQGKGERASRRSHPGRGGGREGKGREKRERGDNKGKEKRERVDGYKGSRSRPAAGASPTQDRTETA
ncbi:unnamed protein product [Chrysoparadoxa australica]